MAHAITWHDLPGGDDASRAERRIWRTGALSLVVHAALLVLLVPHVMDLRHPGEESPQPTVPLSIALVAPAQREETRPSQSARRRRRPHPPAASTSRRARRPPTPPIAALPRPPEPDRGAFRSLVPALPEPPRPSPRPEFRPRRRRSKAT
jgi:hypothetical protein